MISRIIILAVSLFVLDPAIFGQVVSSGGGTYSGVTVSWSITKNPAISGHYFVTASGSMTGDSGHAFIHKQDSAAEFTICGANDAHGESYTNVDWNAGAGASNGWMTAKVGSLIGGGGNGTDTVIGITFPAWSTLLAVQTCSISNATAPATSGQTITGFASGAQAGNPYNISVVSGPASASINSSTGAYTLTATGTGAIVFKVWVSGGNGYSQSNDAVGSGTAATSFKVKVTIPANNGEFPIVYTLTQGGIVVGTYTQVPGAGAIITTISLPGGAGDVTVTGVEQGVKTDGVTKIVSPGDVTTVSNQTVTPTQSDTPPTTTITPPPAASSTSKDPTKPANSSAVVWSANNGSQTDLLTNTVFREGITKETDVLDDLLDAMTGKDDDDTDAKVQSATDAATAQGTAIGNAMQGNLDSARSSASGAASALNSSDLFTGGNGIVTGGAPIPAGGSYATTAHLIGDAGPIVSGAAGGALDVNPVTSSTLGRIMGSGRALAFITWIRNFICWASIILFLKWVLDRVLVQCFQLGMISPMHLTPSARILLQTEVLGNSVGVIGAGIAWGLSIVVISTAFLAAPSLLVAAFYSTSQFSSLFSEATAAKAAADGAAGGLSDVFSWVYLILPVSVLVTIFLNQLLIRFTGIAQYVIVTIGLKLATAI